jgi:hypothetical protein
MRRCLQVHRCCYGISWRQCILVVLCWCKLCRSFLLAEGFAVGAEYYVEFSITVVGSKKFVTVCCTVSGMQVVKVLGGRNLDTTGCKNRILKSLRLMWEVWGGSGCGLFQFITPVRLKELKKKQETRDVSQDCRCSSWNSSRVQHKYKSEILSLEKFLRCDEFKVVYKWIISIFFSLIYACKLLKGSTFALQ